MNKTPSVLISILNYNSADETCALVELLSHLQYQNVSFIVIDNNSAEESKAALSRRIPEGHLWLRAENTGYAGGNNLAVHRALQENYDYVWILNPDARPAIDSLQILVDLMENRSNVAAVGPRLICRDGNKEVFGDGGSIFPERGFLTHFRNTGLSTSGAPSGYVDEVDFLSGAVLLLRVRAVRDIGYFREDFFLYYEETEWCLRARHRGWKALVNTHATASVKRSEKHTTFHYYMSRNSILLAKIEKTFVIKTIGARFGDAIGLASRFFLEPKDLWRIKVSIAVLCGAIAGMLKSPRKRPTSSITLATGEK